MQARTLVYAYKRENAQYVKFNNLITMAKKEKYTNIPKQEVVSKNEWDQSGTFMIINVDDQYRIGVAGRWMTKNIFKTPEEAQAYIDSKPWDLIINMAATMAEFVNKEMSNQSNK